MTKQQLLEQLAKRRQPNHTKYHVNTDKRSCNMGVFQTDEEKGTLTHLKSIPTDTDVHPWLRQTEYHPYYET